MADPLGDLEPREFTPGLRTLVYDPDIPGNPQVEVVDPTSADAGMRYSEAITAANAWQASAEVDLSGYATEDYVDAQLQPILDALTLIMGGGDDVLTIGSDPLAVGVDGLTL